MTKTETKEQQPEQQGNKESSIQDGSGGGAVWMEKKKRVRDEPNASMAPSLPLDWTRVKRRRPGSNGEDDEECVLPAVVATLDEDALTPGQQLVKGLGVICLHDSNPSWFQGYFFPNFGGFDPSDKTQALNMAQQQKPWGLLAVQEELDECMQCADGGYKRVTLTVLPFPERRKESIRNIEVTGGDMVRFAGEKVSLEPHQLMTGPQAVPIVEKIFQDLLQKVRGKFAEDEPSSVLDMMPDVAIITGPMKLVLSKKNEDDDFDF